MPKHSIFSSEMSDLTAGTGAPPDDTSNSGTPRFTLRDFVLVLFKYKGVVLCTFLATVLGTLAWLWIRSDSYETSAKFVIKFTREAADPRTSLSPATTRVLNPSRPDINTEAELIKSYVLVDEVVTKMHLDQPSNDPPPPQLMRRIKYELKRVYRWMEDVLEDIQIRLGLKEALTLKEKVIVQLVRGLKVETVKDSSVVKVSLTSPIKQGAGSVVNTLIDFYRARRLSVEKISGKTDFFDQQANSYRDKVRTAEERLQALKQRFNISSMTEQTSLILKSLSDAERTARETADVVHGAEAKSAMLEQQIKRLSPVSVTSQVEQRNAQLDQLSQKKSDLELERQKLLAKFDPEYVAVKDAERQIERLNQLIAETERTVQQSKTTATNTNYTELEKELLLTNQFLASARARLQGQQKAVDDYRNQLQELRQAEISFNQLSREVMMNDETYRLYQRNATEAQANDALNLRGISSIEVVDPAVDPILASGIRKSYLVGGAIALGLLLAIGLAFLFDALDRGVDSTEDVEASLGRPMWGSVRLAKKAKSAAQVFEADTSDFVTLAAKLAASAVGRGSHVFVFHSAGRGAGATTVTTGTARALADSFARKTLIVDPERGPVLDALDKALDAGREVKLPDGAAAKIWQVAPNLAVAQLTQESEDQGLFEQVSALLQMVPEFEFILIDAGASMPSHQRVQLARAAEGVVVVAQYHETRSEVLGRLKEEFRRDGIRIVAGILNKRRFPIPDPIYRLL